MPEYQVQGQLVVVGIHGDGPCHLSRQRQQCHPRPLPRRHAAADRAGVVTGSHGMAPGSQEGRPPGERETRIQETMGMVRRMMQDRKFRLIEVEPARYGRLLEAFAEYGRTVALLRSVVSRLVPSRLPTSGRDRGQSGTDGKNASRLGMEDCPNE